MERPSILTRASLLSRLKNPDDQDSWKTFFCTYWNLIYGYALNAGLTEEEAKEVAQETMIQVSNRIKNFRYDARVGTFKAWLFQLTRWRIADQFEKRMRNTVPVENLEESADGEQDDSQSDHSQLRFVGRGMAQHPCEGRPGSTPRQAQNKTFSGVGLSRRQTVARRQSRAVAQNESWPSVSH